MSSTSTVPMLHSRPSSSDAFQDPSQQSPRLTQASRSMYNNSGQGTNASYRGPAAAPVQPYAFNATPHLRQDSRTTSAPSPAQRTYASVSAAAVDNPAFKDDTLVASRSGSLSNLSTPVPDLTLVSLDSPAVKASPDRYRRPGQRRVDSNNASPKATSPQPTASPALMPSGTHATDHLHHQQPAVVRRQSSADDMTSKNATSEAAKRYRRRSLNGLDSSNLVPQADEQASTGAQRPSPSETGADATSTPTSMNPLPAHRRTSSKDAVDGQKPAAAAAGRADAKAVAVPPRGSSDANKRMASPSPLSKQAVDPESPTKATVSPVKQRSYAAVAQAAANSPSPAAQHLAAVSDKDLNKGMKSRLRRAFSFGSSQELRRTSAENNLSTAKASQGQQQPSQDDVDDELDAEQREIARRQEAAGIGAGIYSGQGGFTGSTDNVSISSTASSASMMLRKMGHGARKGARSIKGLFRPKSVIGVPAADGPVQVQRSAPLQPSLAQVSMVTVEAERQKVNVNDADPADRLGGGTGFPKLERNSIDAAANPALSGARGSADGTDSATSRRSIVGSDKDRAEILAAVKKGILKRSGTSSPVLRPADGVPHILESPASSMPSTPKDRAGSMNGNVNGDYFSTRLGSLTTAKSMPSTPNGTSRNISFSPRIQFHDAWSSTEYDRRGEIATCNRLTPMLAQQIKEELNNFKMVGLSDPCRIVDFTH